MLQLEQPLLWLLWNGEERRSAIDAIQRARLGLHKVVLAPITAEDRLRRGFHAMAGDCARQATFAGRRMSPQQWKTLLISGHAVASNQESELISGLEHELVDIRESTAQMSGRRLSSCCEYTRAWGDCHGVHWTNPFDQQGNER